MEEEGGSINATTKSFVEGEYLEGENLMLK